MDRLDGVDLHLQGMFDHVNWGGHFRGPVGFRHDSVGLIIPLYSELPAQGPLGYLVPVISNTRQTSFLSISFPGIYPSSHSLCQPVYFPFLFSGKGFWGIPVYSGPVMVEQEHTRPPFQAIISGHFTTHSCCHD